MALGSRTRRGTASLRLLHDVCLHSVWEECVDCPT